MASLMINNETEDSYEIFYDNKISAQIMIRSIFEPKGGDKYENLKVEYD